MDVIRICSGPRYDCNYNNKCIPIVNMIVPITVMFARNMQKTKDYLLFARGVCIWLEHHYSKYLSH